MHAISSLPTNYGKAMEIKDSGLSPAQSPRTPIESLRQRATPKLDENWRVIYEKIQFSDDDRTQRPLVVCQTINNERGKFKEIQIWLCIFDFEEKKLVKQKPIWFPELDLTYEPQSICLSASSEPVRDRENKGVIEFH